MPAATTTRRDRLVAAALDVLEEDGPAAVTTRALTQRAGLSTMSVYSEFGSFGALVGEVIRTGFGGLADALAEIGRTDDPVADLLVLAGTYRAYAHAHPRLYAVMVGTATLGGHQRSEPEVESYLSAFGQAVDLVAKAMAQGRFDPGEPMVAGAQLVSALHGGVTLEMSGLLDVVGDPFERVLLPLVHSLLAGLGDDPGRLAASVASAAGRLEPLTPGQ